MADEHYAPVGEKAPTKKPFVTRKKLVYGIIGVVVVVVVAVAVGLGVGLTRHKTNNDSSAKPDNGPTDIQITPLNTTADISYDPADAHNTTGIWQPAVGASWQIILEHLPPAVLTPNATNNYSIYDIDLFTNNKSSITTFKSSAFNAKVICYFSAGSYEDYRPDAADFKTSDYGSPLGDWPGEWWLNTSSPNVRRIMLNRLDFAVAKGCDGVDPDNVDGYNNKNGLNLQAADALEYMTFLAAAAHKRGLSIGLKNADALVNGTVGFLQYQVNESCEVLKECALWQPFIQAQKPVFHVAYPKDAGPGLSTESVDSSCTSPGTKGFSTLLKRYTHIDEWTIVCPASTS